MISYDQFGRLRLSEFVDRLKVVSICNWEFMGHLWLGEAVGFTEWLRLEDDPHVVRSISLDLVTLDPETTQSINARIGLPLCRGMTRTDLEHIMGKPVGTVRCVPDRYSVWFRFGEQWTYYVHCTLHEKDGLIYVVIMEPSVADVLNEINEMEGGATGTITN